MTAAPQAAPDAAQGAIGASIEIGAREAMQSQALAALIPPGTRVYLPDLGNASHDMWIKSARRIAELGFRAVPHVAARRVATRAELEKRIKAFAFEAGVEDLLLLGGSPARPAGPFSSAMELLDTGLLDQCGIKSLGIGGHPEGSPDFSEAVALDALHRKSDYGKRTDAAVRIVTQFGFDAAQCLRWLHGIRQQGIDLPVHIGLAGPTRLPTLLRYAVSCGVGNSIELLRKHAGSLVSLTGTYRPEDMVRELEAHNARGTADAVQQIHVFAFGGLASTARWLRQRGSWQ